MSKILTSKQSELESGRKSLSRLLLLGGVVAVTILAAVLIFTYMGR